MNWRLRDEKPVSNHLSYYTAYFLTRILSKTCIQYNVNFLFRIILTAKEILAQCEVTDYSRSHRTCTLRQTPVMPTSQHADAVNADPMFVKTTTVASALCLQEKGRGVHVEMTHSSPPIKQINITSTVHTDVMCSLHQVSPCLDMLCG
jgi:hypothetical protein